MVTVYSIVIAGFIWCSLSFELDLEVFTGLSMVVCPEDHVAELRRVCDVEIVAEVFEESGLPGLSVLV